MFSLHSLAAINIVIGVDVISKGVVLISALILVIAFFVGFTKGFRRLNWKGASCLAAFGLTVGVSAILKQYGLAVNTATMQQFGVDRHAWTAILVLLAAVALVAVIYGICTKAFRPYSKWVTSNPVYIDKGWEYEDDTAETHGEVQSRLVWKNANAPSIFGRILGGLVAMLDAAAVIIGLLSVALLTLGKVPIIAENGTVQSLLAQTEMKAIYSFVCTYGPDFLCICVILMTTLQDHQYGFIYSLFNLIKKLGGLILAVLACYIPFSPWVEAGGFLSSLAPLIDVLGSWVAMVPFMETLPGVATIVGKVLLAIILVVVGLLIAWLLKIAFAKAVTIVESNKITKTLDNVLVCILYFILGLLICLIFSTILYTCQYYGWFDFSTFFEKGTFAGYLYSLCETFIPSLLATLPF